LISASFQTRTTGCNYSERTSLKQLLLPILAIVVIDESMILNSLGASIILFPDAAPFLMKFHTSLLKILI
jgi:hypothetical protein